MKIVMSEDSLAGRKSGVCETQGFFYNSRWMGTCTR